MIGLGQFGLEIEKPDEKIREITLPYEESNFLKKIILKNVLYRGALETNDRVIRVTDKGNRRTVA